MKLRCDVCDKEIEKGFVEKDSDDPIILCEECYEELKKKGQVKLNLKRGEVFLDFHELEFVKI